MKTPISYYGGKQMMCRHILPLIPVHNLYCEPFFGGGAIFFAKEQSEIEVINDVNGEVINFYQVLQSGFEALNRLVQKTLHSRELYRDALIVYQHPHLFTRVKRAWAFWILTNQGFATKIGTWGYDRSAGSIERKVANSKTKFTSLYADRLAHTQIESNGAIKVVKSRDSISSFFYCDPPYFNSNMGHYDGYNEDDFKQLLKALSGIAGKFLLSSYPSEPLDQFVKKYRWHQIRNKRIFEDVWF